MRYSDSFEQFLKKIGRFPVLSREEEIELFRQYGLGGVRGELARRKIMNHNLKLVVSVAKKHAQGFDLEDMIQEGTFGLIRAIEKFDLAKGFKFSTYATRWIIQTMHRAKQDKGSAIRLPAYLQDGLGKINKMISQSDPDQPPPIEDLQKATGFKKEKITRILDAHANRHTISLDRPITDSPQEVTLKDSNAFGYHHDYDTPIYSSQVLEKLAQALQECRIKERHKDIIERRYGLGGYHRHTLGEIAEAYQVSGERIRQIETKFFRKVGRWFKRYAPDFRLPS